MPVTKILDIGTTLPSVKRLRAAVNSPVSAYVLRLKEPRQAFMRGDNDKNFFGRVSNSAAAVRLRRERRPEEAAGRQGRHG
jgi:hypothetical protein